MTLSTHEFIRRFLMHVLPGGFHRIRHYGLLASGNRAANIARARELLAVPVRSEQPETSEAAALDEPRMLPRPCPCCGGRMFIIETFARGCEPKHRPTPASGGDQDRHLMMPSSPIHDRTDARHSGRLPPGSTPACVGPQDWPVSHTANLSDATCDPLVRASTHAHASSEKRSDRQPRLQLPQHSRRAPNPHSARCTVGAPHPAISCLGAFRTPAVRARG